MQEAALIDLQKYKDELKKLKAGRELDELVAANVLGFKRGAIFQTVKHPKTGKEVGQTNWTDSNGRPVFVPPVSVETHIATVLLEDLKHEFTFGFDGNKYWIDVKRSLFHGSTLGEVFAKGLLYQVEYEKYTLG
ncbi:hypothetical protein [Halobacillus ihumii]|uniref:hypothetical protein n=1 Tax=Halobacillus ihumii TaxID=2686092 RepID=UPI0013D2C088|nr:hypothetical protein [Halobacillus ihumii]